MPRPWTTGCLLLWCWLLLAGCDPGATSPPDEPGTLRVTFLDVGQGDAALVRTPDGVDALVDAGPPAAGPVVAEALRRAGVKRLEWIVGSHPHSDHIGGFLDLLPRVPVDRALDPGYNHGTSTQLTYLRLLREQGVRVVRARRGQTHALGEQVRLEVVAPEEPLLTGTRSDANNNSVVARLVYGETRFLFTGDMETEQRERLLKSAGPEELAADVLKVAHHGSHNGTDDRFLRAVAPRYAVISLGRDNEYGHPHAVVVNRLKRRETEILRTDVLGDIRFRSDGKTVTLLNPRPPESRKPAEKAPEQGRIIGNRSSNVFHGADCASLPKPGNRVLFDTAAEARAAGFRPHAACVPEGDES